MSEQLNSNQITLVGKVVSECTESHQLYGEKFYEFHVEIPRLSDTSDTLPVTVSERLVDVSKLVIGQHLEIEGQFRSYNKFNAKEGNKLKLIIFARRINLVEETTRYRNEIYLNGFLCKQPVTRKTPFGREIADLILAVNRAYNKSDYIPIITWGRNATFCSQLKVGDNLKIWGRIQSRLYDKRIDDETTVQKVAYEVSVSKLEIVDDNNNSK